MRSIDLWLRGCLILSHEQLEQVKQMLGHPQDESPVNAHSIVLPDGRPAWMWQPKRRTPESLFRQRWAIAFQQTCVQWSEVALYLARHLPEKLSWEWKTIHCYARHHRIGLVSALVEIRTEDIIARIAIFDSTGFLAHGQERMGIRWLAHWQQAQPVRHALAVLLEGKSGLGSREQQLISFANACHIPLVRCVSIEELKAALDEAVAKLNTVLRTTVLSSESTTHLPWRQTLLSTRSHAVESALRRYGPLAYPRPLPKTLSPERFYQWLLFIAMFPGVRDAFIDGLWRLFFNVRDIVVPREELSFLVHHRWVVKDGEGGYYLYPQAAATLALVLGVFPQRIHSRQGIFVSEARAHRGHTLTAYHWLIRAYWDIELNLARAPEEGWKWKFGAGEAWASQYFAYQHRIYNYRPDAYFSFEYRGRSHHFFVEIDGWRASRVVRSLVGRMRVRSYALDMTWGKKLRNLARYYASQEWQWHYETFPHLLVVTENDRILRILHRLYLTLPTPPPTPILVALGDEVDYWGPIDTPWWVLGEKLTRQTLRERLRLQHL